MSSSSQTAPAGTDLDPVLEAARRGDGPAAARAARELLKRPVQPRGAHVLLDAAVNLGDAGLVDAAAAIAARANFAPAGRVHAAWRLAIAGHAAEALAVLLSDPRVLEGSEMIDRALKVLQIVRLRSAPDALARHQSEALLARLLPQHAPPRTPSPHGFAGEPGAAASPLGPPVRVHPAPGLAASVVEEAHGVLAAFDAAAARMRHPGVTVLSDVFVNRRGQVWGRGGRVYVTNGWRVPDASHAAEAGAPVVPEAAFAVETHNNLYHWLIDWLPALAWRLDDPAPTMPLLLRDEPADFVTDSLRLAAAGPVRTVEAGDAVFVRRLHVADRDPNIFARQGAVGGLVARLRDRAVAEAGIAPPQRLYLSRRDSRKRSMTNEAELEAALERRGFACLTMTERPLAEKLALVSGAEWIVSPHGAGLSLLAFAAPGRRVLELVPALRGGLRIRATMAQLSRLVGHEHHMWLQEVAPMREGWTLDLDPGLALLDSLQPMEADAAR